jgi:hemerythrin-like domain-containing protein
MGARRSVCATRTGAPASGDAAPALLLANGTTIAPQVPKGIIDMAKSDTDPMGAWKLLAQEHDQLDQLFEQLLDALRADAREDAMRLWTEFDAGLCEHMQFEEKVVLPALRTAEPREAAALAEEHDQIRAKLAELGVALDLHEVRAETVADFVEQLRRHARRENALAYQWAEHHLDAEDRNALKHRANTSRIIRQRLCDLSRMVKSQNASTG